MNYELADSDKNEIVLLVPKISEMILISHEMMRVKSEKEPSLVQLSILNNENQLVHEEKMKLLVEESTYVYTEHYLF